jgi:hypothetical protein
LALPLTAFENARIAKTRRVKSLIVEHIGGELSTVRLEPLPLPRVEPEGHFSRHRVDCASIRNDREKPLHASQTQIDNDRIY